MRLGIVTCSKCRQLIPAEQALLPLLDRHGIVGVPVVWNYPEIDWRSFDALLVRSIWDYHLHPEHFRQWLDTLEALQLPGWNSVSVLRWNHHKFYLRDLASRGIPVVPSLFFEQHASDAMSQVKRLQWKHIVVKPAVSASGYRTQAFNADDSEAAKILADAAAFGDFLVQPFLPDILHSGEVSLIFFNHRFSHAVLKRPGTGEFRVQAEHGGNHFPYFPDEAVVAQAQQVLDKSGHDLLYARVDGVVRGGEFQLMELELIEPDLFLEAREGSGEQFVEAIVRRVGS